MNSRARLKQLKRLKNVRMSLNVDSQGRHEVAAILDIFRDKPVEEVGEITHTREFILASLHSSRLAISQPTLKAALNLFQFAEF